MSLRERTRRAVRSEIVDVAMRLFLVQGFEATTVDEIARAAGISRRSYFRYFTGKDEAFTEGLASIGRTIAGDLDGRPEGEPLWESLRRAFDPLVEQAEGDPRAEALGRLLLERPAVQQGKEGAWRVELTEAMKRRMPADDGDGDVRAGALSAAALACLHVAQAQWLETDERRQLGPLVDAAMNAVHPLGRA